jgi:hypothetical protein
MDAKVSKSPLIFEDRRDGRIDAMLGAITVGCIVPIDHTENRAAYTFALPPTRGFLFARSIDRAKAKLKVLTADWLKAADLRGA